MRIYFQHMAFIIPELRKKLTPPFKFGSATLKGYVIGMETSAFRSLARRTEGRLLSGLCKALIIDGHWQIKI
jgi:hypothetical protein